MAYWSLELPTISNGWIPLSPSVLVGLTVNCWFVSVTPRVPGHSLHQSLFENPTLEERVLYTQYWQKKLRHNKDISFPDTLGEEIAKLTYDFSFAYLKEALCVPTRAPPTTQSADLTPG